jgi:hypothetical protein
MILYYKFSLNLYKNTAILRLEMPRLIIFYIFVFNYI